MALFDSKSSEILDDTIPLMATIETAENIQGFTEYVIRVNRSYNDQKWPSWTVRRRYRDFANLNGKLVENASHLDLQLPPKKMFGNLNREFVAKRTQDLQIFLDGILSFPYFALSRYVKAFLDPKNYSKDFSDLALQNVSMCLRSSQALLIDKTFFDMGWRLRKAYFLVKPVDKTKDERQLVTWAFYGPNFCLDYTDAQIALDFLSKLKHSQIHSSQSVICTEKGAAFLKGPLLPSGSLRDVLCNAKSQKSFISKYAYPKEPNCFDGRQLQLLGRKILEILKLLKDKNIPFAHLHCGNLAVTEDERVKVLDLENDILGLPPFYRAFMIQCKGIKTYDDVVVYCFGLTLYEIAVGVPLNQPFLVNELALTDIPQPLGIVLQELLSQKATDTGFPSLEDLLSRDVFVPTWYQTISMQDDLNFKVPSKVKQLFAKCKDAFMERLRQDQADYRRAEKMRKAKDYVESDEQRKLRKRAARLAIKESESSVVPSKTTNGNAPSVVIPAKSVDGSEPSAASQPSDSIIHMVKPLEAIQQPVVEAVQKSANDDSQNSLISASQSDRSALLESIRNFKAAKLKKAVTNDKSAPRL